MKRLLTLLAVAAVIALSANTALASVIGSPHEYGTGTAYGQCQVCHVPHAAALTKRLWRVDPTAVSGNTWADSTIGKLCGSCHYAGGPIASVSNKNSSPPNDQAGLAYDAASHGASTAELTGTASGDLRDAFRSGIGSSKPYTTGNQITTNQIECTSCHNPHNDGASAGGDGNGIRPFLRKSPGGATYSTFCADCHYGRYNTTVGDSNKVLWNNVTTSMHPVDIALTDNNGNGGTFITQNPPNALKTSPSTVITVADPWTLGGKMENWASTVSASSTIACITCHAVHSPATTNPTGYKGLHLLAIDNQNTYAALCEGCHGGPTAFDGGPRAVGTTTGDHPIDALTNPGGGTGPVIDRWFSDGSTPRYERYPSGADTVWPRSVSPRKIICTSCHSAHAGVKAGKLTRRGSTNTFCNACHADPAPAGHHSYVGNWPQSKVGCTTTDLVNGLSGCHAAFGVAHNGFSFLFTQAQNGKSGKCNGCHLGALWGNLTQDPYYALSNAGYGGFTLATTIPNGNLGGVGGASPNHLQTHYIGTFDRDGANSIKVKATKWTMGFSKYGSATDKHQRSSDSDGVLVLCESCHSVRWNAGTDTATATQSSGYNINLLLQDYKDDSASQGRSVGAGFCVACHTQSSSTDAAGAVPDTLVENSSIVPANMHPMTAWTVTRAKDVGRSPVTLITGAGSYADNGSRTLAYPTYKANAMDCDSCHRPHLAATKGTWDPVTNRGAGTSVILEIAGPDAGTYDNLCKDCHAY